MSRIHSPARGALAKFPAAAIDAASLAVLLMQLSGQAHTADALPSAKGYLNTGDYAVGGVALGGDSDGSSLTGRISMTGVPANADILSAFLYWQTVSSDRSQVDGVKFRESPI